MNLSHKIYQVITLLLSPFFKGYVLWRAASGKEDKSRLHERWGLPSCDKRGTGPLYWIHAVSVGEANSALVLVRLLKELKPNARILMTTGTVTSADLMAKKLPEGTIHQYFPLDTPFSVRSFLDFWEPSLALWVESEIWPNQLMELKKRQIPLLLMNGRMSERSFNRWSRISWFIKPLMETFRWCGVQTAQDLKYFQSLGVFSAEVMPNLKMLTMTLPYSKEEHDSLAKELVGRFVWFASCTHPGEEEGVLTAHRELLKVHPEALLFLAPRHTARLTSVTKSLKREGLHYSLRTSCPSPRREDSVHVIDSMGELGLFYSLASMTFIGGTWAPKGGHNPIEAAQLGSYVLHGHSIHSNRVLYELLVDMGLSERVDSPRELCEKLLAGPPEQKKSWGTLRDSGLGDIKKFLAEYVTEEEKQAC